MKKIANISLIVLLAIAAFSVILWLVRGNNLQEVDFMLYVAYAYLGIAVLAWIILSAMNMGKSRGNSRIGLWVYGGTVALAVIFYFTIASSTAVVGADKTVFDNAFTLKATDAMLYLAYLALGLTVIAMLWGVVRKAIK
jgi:predicted membrane channel-forming protein YqfA (hemolysin III family)